MHPYQVRYYKKLLKYERSLLCQVSTPRSLAKAEEPIESVELRAFRDASGIGVPAAVYIRGHTTTSQSKQWTRSSKVAHGEERSYHPYQGI